MVQDKIYAKYDKNPLISYLDPRIGLTRAGHRKTLSISAKEFFIVAL